MVLDIATGGCEWLLLTQAFVRESAGKNLLLGRFVAPVTPTIAAHVPAYNHAHTVPDEKCEEWNKLTVRHTYISNPANRPCRSCLDLLLSNPSHSDINILWSPSYPPLQNLLTSSPCTFTSHRRVEVRRGAFFT